MAKTRAQKEKFLSSLTDGLKTSKGVVFANFQGLKVKESEELRKKCREQGVQYVASKKTLVARALSALGHNNVDVGAFSGGVSVVLGPDDVAPAQIIAEYAKTHEAVKIFGGILEGAFIDAAKVTALSKLPTRHQLFGQLVGTLNASVSGLVNVLAGNLRGLVTVLRAVGEKKGA